MYLFLDLFCGFFPRFLQVELFGIPNERMFCEHFCKDQASLSLSPLLCLAFFNTFCLPTAVNSNSIVKSLPVYGNNVRE